MELSFLGGCRDVSAVKSTSYSFRGPRFSSHTTYCSSQPSVTPRESNVLFWSPQTLDTQYRQRCGQNTHTHIIKLCDVVVSINFNKSLKSLSTSQLNNRNSDWKITSYILYFTIAAKFQDLKPLYSLLKFNSVVSSYLHYQMLPFSLQSIYSKVIVIVVVL